MHSADPGYLPYYTPAFFDTIRRGHVETPHDVTILSIRQWVQILTEDCLTMQVFDGLMRFKPCRAQGISPSTDWTLSYVKDMLPSWS